MLSACAARCNGRNDSAFFERLGIASGGQPALSRTDLLPISLTAKQPAERSYELGLRRDTFLQRMIALS